MIISIPMTLFAFGEEKDFEVDVDVSFWESDKFPFEIHGCFCEELENHKPNLDYVMHVKAVSYIQENYLDLVSSIEDARAESKWESEEDR